MRRYWKDQKIDNGYTTEEGSIERRLEGNSFPSSRKIAWIDTYEGEGKKDSSYTIIKLDESYKIKEKENGPGHWRFCSKRDLPHNHPIANEITGYHHASRRTKTGVRS